MPVHYFPNYPTTKVFTNACVVVHKQRVYHSPLSYPHEQGSTEYPHDFGKRHFRSADWTNNEITFETSPNSWMLYINFTGLGRTFSLVAYIHDMVH